MATKPIELTLYDPETNEVVDTLVRSYIPWEIMKTAIRLQKVISAGDMDEDELFESMTALVVAVFGDRVSSEQVKKGTDAGEMSTVIQEIINRASDLAIPQAPGNPTKAAGKKKARR